MDQTHYDPLSPSLSLRAREILSNFIRMRTNHTHTVPAKAVNGNRVMRIRS